MQASYVKPAVYHKPVYPAPMAMPEKGKKKPASNFFRYLNPFTWFNDFRDIPITLEEFSYKGR